MYQPREDSLLILKNVKNHIKPGYKVLDMGTGTGILAKESARYTKNVIACDINKESEGYLNKNIKFIISNLFSNIKGRFNLILFNPPYLPSKNIQDKRVDGGKNGTEIINRFLKQAKEHLEKNGKILLVCSSLNKNVENLFTRHGYKYKKIDEKKMFFEKLYVYKLEFK